jgi:hypothetical protein
VQCYEIFNATDRICRRGPCLQRRRAPFDGRQSYHEGLQLSAGKAFPKEPIILEAGKYYRWKIESDGSSEMAIAAPEFFRFIWINEVVINDIEVRPLGLDSIEFDDAGAAVISFVPIRPGEFEYFMPNSGDAYRGKIVVK